MKEQCDLRTLLEDRMRVMVRPDALTSPISTRLLPVIQMTSQRVPSEVSKVLQSHENIQLDQSFTIDVVAVRQPTGSEKSIKVLDYNKDCLGKRSIIIYN